LEVIMAVNNGADARQGHVRLENGVAAILHEAAAVAHGNGCLIAEQGPLDWKSWVGKGGKAESLPLPSPADLLQGGGTVEPHLESHGPVQGRGARL
jgi:hypothetical protein